MNTMIIMALVFAPNFITTRPGTSVHAQSGAGPCGAAASIVNLAKSVMVRYADTGGVTALAPNVARMMTTNMTMTMIMTMTRMMGHTGAKMVITMAHTGAPTMQMVVTMIMTMTMNMMMGHTGALSRMTEMWKNT